MKTLLARWAAPTPKFFKIIRNVGLVIGAVGTAILTAPVALPAAIVSNSGYLVTAGAIATAVSQLTVLQEDAPPSSLETDEP